MDTLLTNEETVAEIWLPSRNETESEAVSRLISTFPVNISLEYFGKGAKRGMLIRGSLSDVKSAAAMITAAYPAASLHFSEHNPVCLPDHTENLTTADYGFAGEGYMPLKPFESYRECDPVHGILAGLLDLGADEMVWIRIKLLSRRKPEWLEPVLRRVKAETQKGFVTNTAMETTGNSIGAYTPVEHYRAVDLKKATVTVLMSACWVFVLFLLMMKMFRISAAFLAVAVLLTALKIRMPSQMEDPWYLADLETLRKKVSFQHEYNLVSIRVTASSGTLQRALVLQKRFETILNSYSFSGGNSLVTRDIFNGSAPYPDTEMPVMEMCDWELASLWHIPWNSASVSPGLIPVRGMEMRCPDPDEVSGFYRIGSYARPNGDIGGVFLNSAMMKHNMFLIGKPGTGKTTMMEHIAKAAIGDTEQNQAVIVIDPHGDMFSRLSGCIPKERLDDVILLDFGDPDYVLPYNPLDIHSSGLDPEQAVRMIVDIGKSLWTTSWGPRMQIPLQRSVLAIAAHNRSMPASYGADGLSLMGVILNAREDARRDYIKAIKDERIRNTLLRYFIFDFDQYKEYLQQQVILPVLSKSYRFEESPMLEYFSAPHSVLNPREIIENRKILLVNTRMSDLGSEMSDFLGSFIISLLLKEISRQGEHEAGKRIPVLLLIDEFQTYSGVPWQELLAQLRKWGGRTVLGTQSFASMISDESRDLPGIIMSGVYSLFSFTVNGEDADYLSRNELSEKFGGPSRDTLISLDPYTCYGRIMRPDGKLTRPFFFRTAAPASPAPDIRQELLDRRERYARKKQEAVAEALGYLDRIEEYRFYSSGRLYSDGTDAEVPSRPYSNERDSRYPASKKLDEKKADERELESAERLLAKDNTDDMERDKMLKERYGDLFPK